MIHFKYECIYILNILPKYLILCVVWVYLNKAFPEDFNMLVFVHCMSSDFQMNACLALTFHPSTLLNLLPLISFSPFKSFTSPSQEKRNKPHLPHSTVIFVTFISNSICFLFHYLMSQHLEHMHLLSQ